jgi:NAD-reducing hydrogenase small subunit
MNKPHLATLWLDGCSGCHMSLLDMDERLIDIAQQVEIVYSPYVDRKTFPEGVDITLVEGAIGTREDREKIRLVRQHTKTLVSLGDCAVTGNVSAMRNIFKVETIQQHIYTATAAPPASAPITDVPLLLETVYPIHAIVPVDVFVPGCPPAADIIYMVLTELLAGRMPDVAAHTRFGA